MGVPNRKRAITRDKLSPERLIYKAIFVYQISPLLSFLWTAFSLCSPRPQLNAIQALIVWLPFESHTFVGLPQLINSIDLNFKLISLT